jgi:hypothetical protein
VTLDDSDGVKLSGWRLDGENLVMQSAPMPPAAASR